MFSVVAYVCTTVCLGGVTTLCHVYVPRFSMDCAYLCSACVWHVLLLVGFEGLLYSGILHEKWGACMYIAVCVCNRTRLGNCVVLVFLIMHDKLPILNRSICARASVGYAMVWSTACPCGLGVCGLGRPLRVCI